MRWWSWPGFLFGLGGGPEALEGGPHPLEELLVTIGGHVEDAGPGRDPADLVALGHPRASVADGFEGVVPGCGRAAAFVGDEAEYPARLGPQHRAVTAVADAPTRPDRVVPDESRALDRCGDVAFPGNPLAFRAP